jgi:hypothetical protein
MAYSAQCRECYDEARRRERQEATRIWRLESALKEIAWCALYRQKDVRKLALDALKTDDGH